MSNPPAGWYPDPTGQPNTIRWWNGTQWTNRTEKEEPEPADDPTPQPAAANSTAASASSVDASADKRRADPDNSTVVTCEPVDEADEPAAGNTEPANTASGWAAEPANTAAAWTIEPATEASSSGSGGVAGSVAEPADSGPKLSPAEKAKSTWMAPVEVPAAAGHWTQRPAAPEDAEPITQEQAAIADEQAAQQTGWKLTLAHDSTSTTRTPTPEPEAKPWAATNWTQPPTEAPTPKDPAPDADATQEISTPQPTTRWAQPTGEEPTAASGGWGIAQADQSAAGSWIMAENVPTSGSSATPWGTPVEVTPESSSEADESQGDATQRSTTGTEQSDGGWGSNPQEASDGGWGTNNPQTGTNGWGTPAPQQGNTDPANAAQSGGTSAGGTVGGGTAVGGAAASGTTAGGAAAGGAAGGAAAGGWGTAPAADAGADGWGTPAKQEGVAEGWGTSASQDPAAQGWGASTAQDPAAQGWGESGGQQEAAEGWGASASQDPAAQGWGTSTAQDPAAQGWGESGGQQEAAEGWGASASQEPAAQGWGSSGTQQEGAGAAGGQQGGWGSTGSPQTSGDGWGASGVQAPEAGQWGGEAAPQSTTTQWGAAGAGGRQTSSQWGSTGQQQTAGTWQNADAAQWQGDGGPQGGGVRKGKEKTKESSGGGMSKTPLIIGGSVALVILVVVAVLLITTSGDKKTADPGTTTPQPTGSATTPTAPTTPGAKPGQSKNPKLHEGNRISSDAISFPRQAGGWSDRKRLIQQLLNSSGQYVTLQEDFDGSNDWYADMFVGGLGTATPFSGDPKATAATLLSQVHSNNYGDIPVTYKAVGNGAVKRSDKAGWYFQETVTAKSPKITSVLLLTVAVFDLGDGTAVAYVSDIPTNRPDLKAAESKVYKGINVG